MPQTDCTKANSKQSFFFGSVKNDGIMSLNLFRSNFIQNRQYLFINNEYESNIYDNSGHSW